MTFKELVSAEDWEKTPDSIKKIAEDMLINYNKEKPESIEGWELSYHGKDVPEFMQGKNKMTPGPDEDWKITPEPVQEAIMDIAAKTIRKMS